MRLEGKVALITGGTSGIGSATAVRFAQEGAAVAITGRSAGRGAEVISQITEAGGEGIFIASDVRLAEDCRNAVDQTLQRFGKIDVLFNNAGVFHPKTLPECTEEEWDETIDSSRKGAFLMSKYALPSMIEQGGGSIIHTSSGWGILGGCVAAGFAAFALFPQQIAKHAPGTIAVYEKAGIDINFRGFEIRNIKQQHMVSDGTLVYAVRGEVTNVAGKQSKAPALRFILRDGRKREVYTWTLAGVTNRMLKPDETTSFVTRIASPPETADELQIRFAHATEIGSNARP